MKFKEFKEIAERVAEESHIDIDDVEFEVSLWPTETDAELGIRYFGEIHELMVYDHHVMILSDGDRNYPV